MDETEPSGKCYNCGVKLYAKPPINEVQLCGYVPDKIGEFSIDNMRPACAICYRIHTIQQDLNMLSFFVRDRTRLLKDKDAI